MAAALRDLGFEVTHKKNATKSEMEDALAGFANSIRGRTGVALFYNAGHGVQVEGKTI